MYLILNTISPPRLSLNYQNQTRTFHSPSVVGLQQEERGSTTSSCSTPLWRPKKARTAGGTGVAVEARRWRPCLGHAQATPFSSLLGPCPGHVWNGGRWRGRGRGRRQGGTVAVARACPWGGGSGTWPSRAWTRREKERK
jgi:hypothetical protein